MSTFRQIYFTIIRIGANIVGIRMGLGRSAWSG